LSASDQKLGAITDYVSNSVFSKEDAARAALNALNQQSAQTRAQDLQNMVSSLMSAHTLLSEAKLGILNQG
jgi:translation initiation factor 2B subunit (eIF-2B alpha/beta/delta family)